MREPTPDPVGQAFLPANDDLALTALRFAAGELPTEKAEEFAERMAHDQDARDALADAVRLSAAVLGQPAPTADPLLREAVREDLQPTVWNRLFRRRPYRGHPIAWASLGGGIAAGLTVVGVWLGDPPAAPPPVPTTPVAVVPAPVEVRPQVVAVKPARPVKKKPVEVAPAPAPAEETVVTSLPEPVERFEKPAGKSGDLKAVEGVDAGVR